MGIKWKYHIPINVIQEYTLWIEKRDSSETCAWKGIYGYMKRPCHIASYQASFLKIEQAIPSSSSWIIWSEGLSIGIGSLLIFKAIGRPRPHIPSVLLKFKTF